MKQVPQIRRRFMRGSERQQHGRNYTSGLATTIYPRAEELYSCDTGEVFPLRFGGRNLQKRHIHLHTFTFHALGYNRIVEYNTLVISNL